jgi:hypothetical protein
MGQELNKNVFLGRRDIIIQPAWCAGECGFVVVHLDSFIDFNFQLQSKMAFSKHPCHVCERGGWG